MLPLYAGSLPTGFTYLEDPRFILSIDYLSTHNFMGRAAAGYMAKVCILTEPAAEALIAVQNELDTLNKGYRLKIFDAYRPVTAVNDFINWAKDPDDKMRTQFYPSLTKADIFKQGYIAERSSHSRGSTIDLTITVYSAVHSNYVELDMGTIFDFFDKAANTDASNISSAAQENRLFLKTAMEKQDFENYPLEWWHYTLKNEPFPNTYFDFPIL